MKILLHFSLVQEGTELHSLVEQVMKAQFACQNLMTVEQRQCLERHPEVLEQFAGVFDEREREEGLKKQINDWADAKFFKH
mmetsp:Transcript_15068/g.10945  ORF Transcript_15068/g.10945 Transcript_15068/m.10945 type:complete len:81 (+) Transcript_15068:974-1216(+)